MIQIATSTIHDGYYTISQSNGKHYTFRIRTQPQDANFAPGKQVIAYLNGPCNESDYMGFGFVNEGRIFPWKRFQSGYDKIITAARFLIQGDHAEAGKMYAQESGNCYICNRVLTTPESIAAGIGPTCAAKEGIVRPEYPVTPSVDTLAEERKQTQVQRDAERTAYLYWELSMGL